MSGPIDAVTGAVRRLLPRCREYRHGDRIVFVADERAMVLATAMAQVELIAAPGRTVLVCRWASLVRIRAFARSLVAAMVTTIAAVALCAESARAGSISAGALTALPVVAIAAPCAWLLQNRLRRGFTREAATHCDGFLEALRAEFAVAVVELVGLAQLARHAER